MIIKLQRTLTPVYCSIIKENIKMCVFIDNRGFHSYNIMKEEVIVNDLRYLICKDNIWFALQIFYDEICGTKI